ncbi:TIGR03084 family metal-binding protein [Virgisporangium aurantiacum]
MPDPTLARVLADLAAESADLDRIVAALPADDFSRPTPAPGWTIAHQIAHLAWTDWIALTAVTDPDAFLAQLSAPGAPDPGFVDRATETFLGPPQEVLYRWRKGRADLATALTATTASKVLWFGTSMSPTSMVTARLMETWAHGLDVADTLGIERGFTPRLRHVAHLGYRTIGHGFMAHGRPRPAAEFRVELSTPDGSLWTFGPDDAPEQISGPALDFCLLVTQRRHPDELAIKTTGPVATEWLEVAQAFAGPPGAKR